MISTIPPRSAKFKLAQFPGALVARAREFINSPGVWSLYLYGALGSQKTSFAVAILVAWEEWLTAQKRSGTGIFVPAYTAATCYRNLEGPSGVSETWEKCDLLILDDLGANRKTPHVTEQLLFLLERRYDWERKTIITTNMDLNEFARHIDGRAVSRLLEGIVLDLGDKDHRREHRGAGGPT
jgi:DNA replication protein DnaC